jgi:hypothetical protein
MNSWIAKTVASKDYQNVLLARFKPASRAKKKAGL